MNTNKGVIHCFSSKCYEGYLKPVEGSLFFIPQSFRDELLSLRLMAKYESFEAFCKVAIAADWRFVTLEQANQDAWHVCHDDKRIGLIQWSVDSRRWSAIIDGCHFEFSRLQEAIALCLIAPVPQVAAHDLKREP